jgi:hypothetical protein
MITKTEPEKREARAQTFFDHGTITSQVMKNEPFGVDAGCIPAGIFCDLFPTVVSESERPRQERTLRIFDRRDHLRQRNVKKDHLSKFLSKRPPAASTNAGTPPAASTRPGTPPAASTKAGTWPC